jgi:hypothetical protein
MNPGAIKTNKMNRAWPRQPFLRPAIEPVESVGSDDLSRFEGEGGLEAPVQASNLIDVPLETAICRRQRRPEDRTSSAVLNQKEIK